MSTKTTKINGGFLFKSSDPTWSKWGAAFNQVGSTRWFNTKAEAERYLRTKDDSRAIAGRTIKL